MARKLRRESTHTPCAPMKPKLPKQIWADYDPDYQPNLRWSFYRTKDEQRGNRPDLKPIRLRVRRAR